MSKIGQCKNCEASFDASFKYCPNCGQETADNLTFGILFSNTISNYFSIDARFFRSFVPLMTKPGVLARRFVDGKRLSYLHPAQFYLFISVVFFFIFSFSVREADNQFSKVLNKGFDQEIKLDSLRSEKDSLALIKAKESLLNSGVMSEVAQEDIEALDSVIANANKGTNVSFGFKRSVLDSLIKINAPQAEQLKAMGMDEDASAFTRRFYTQMLKFYTQRGGGILQALYDTIPIAMFFMLPLFALLLKIFYWKRATFAHHMVFSFYFFTFLFTSFCIILLANNVFDLPGWIEFLVVLSFIIYLILALRNFYKSSWLGAIIKANIISFVYMMFIVPIAIFGIMMVSFMLY